MMLLINQVKASRKENSFPMHNMTIILFHLIDGMYCTLYSTLIFVSMIFMPLNLKRKHNLTGE